MTLDWNRPKTLLFGSTALFIGIALIDQLLKKWAYGLVSPVEFGFLKFFPFENSGVFGGYLADLHPWIIRIFFSVLFGFLCLGGFFVVHFLAHKPVPRLKWGIMIYIAGVLGNVWDRMSTGKIVDFIVFDLPFANGMAFNFADFVVVAGFVLILISVWKDAHALWFEGNQRQGHWVEPRFQKGFGALLVLVGFAHFAVIALYSFTFLKVFISGETDLASLNPDRIILDYLVGLFVIEGGAILLTFAISILFSHRLVGPLIALEIYVRRIFDGTQKPEEGLRLRQGDYFGGMLDTIANRVAQAAKDSKKTD